jgi:hypothetical protein
MEALQGRVHQGHAAKGMESQPTDRTLSLAVEQLHTVPLVQQTQRGAQSRQPTANDQGVYGRSSGSKSGHTKVVFNEGLSLM